MKDTETEREAETQAEGEAGSMQGARCGTRSRVSMIMPWAEGRCSTAEPPRDPPKIQFFVVEHFQMLVCCHLESASKKKRLMRNEGHSVKQIVKIKGQGNSCRYKC